MVKPNLFIVGAPKSGTSALYRFLKQHPDIFMPKYKEPHFFSKDLQKESDIFHGFLKHRQVLHGTIQTDLKQLREY